MEIMIFHKPQKTYSTFGLEQILRQCIFALQSRGNALQNMRKLYGLLKMNEERIAEVVGKPIRDLRILEIGPGQGLERARYFSANNDVVTLDIEIVPQGFDLAGYWNLLKTNGLGRFLKTVGRKLLIGQANRKAWKQATGLTETKNPTMVYGDICKHVIDEGGFDLVVSWSVFEHLSDPPSALQNSIRCLRPGGVFYISTHLYTSNNGHHDIRAFTGAEDSLPLWAHLRPSTCHLVKPSAYLNKWRLPQWRDLFSQYSPGYREYLDSYTSGHDLAPKLKSELRQELSEYSDTELLTIDAAFVWKKPEGRDLE